MIKPDYRSAERAACDLLCEYEINQLPIPLEKYNKSFNDLRIKSYSWYAEKNCISIDEVIEHADSDSGCCWYIPKMNKYMILYNDTIKNQGHIRWTIAHELGHYILNHNKRTGKSIISRSALSDKEYQAFEKEANCFARSLLAPPSVLVKLKQFNAKELSEWCEVSLNAASNIISFFRKGLLLGKNHFNNEKVSNLFSDFIFKKNNEHTCLTCKHHFIHAYPKFCPICRSKNLLKKKEKTYMIYDGVFLDENYRAIRCPQCENEEITSGNYCKVCGITVVNRCDNRYFSNGHEIIECDAPADGNARYCTVCGEKTLFFKNKILRDWKESYQELLVKFSDRMFKSGDLPF
ncbi:ImmA/IrrE family metallo-endopeptidase [Paenibacillus filicis]|uniref:ImmA/IrrE family metallo-endopeptidase n=1 Tax=Paenibacillus filicis TaxID=669464 RepID=A0ABU9DVP3_9BACL